MFIALYGQFVINTCILIYMLLQIYNNFRANAQTNKLYRYMNGALYTLSARQQETDEDLKQYKATLAALMVTLSQEIDSLDARINHRND